MLRIFLLIATALLFLRWPSPAEVAGAAVVEVAAAADCPCCPASPGADEGCCDDGLGMCCPASAAVVSFLPLQAGTLEVPSAALRGAETPRARRPGIPRHLLRPRDTGPPPTPPPIA